MIKLVCPKCGKNSDKVRTKLIIEATGFTRVVPSRERGVERAIASPIEVIVGQPQVGFSPNTLLVCGKCEEETKSELWRYTVFCDHCGLSITRKPVKDPTKIVDKHICRDNMSLFCDDCWSRSSSKEYCPGCRYRESCSLYSDT